MIFTITWLATFLIPRAFATTSPSVPVDANVSYLDPFPVEIGFHPIQPNIPEPIIRVLKRLQYSTQLGTLADYHPSIYMHCYPTLLNMAAYILSGGKYESPYVKISFHSPYPILMDDDSYPVWVIFPYGHTFWGVFYFFYNNKLGVVIEGLGYDKLSGGFFKHPMGPEELSLRLASSSFGDNSLLKKPLSREARSLRKVFSCLLDNKDFKKALEFFDMKRNGLGRHILFALKLAILDVPHTIYIVKPLVLKILTRTGGGSLCFGVSNGDLIIRQGERYFRFKDHQESTKNAQ
jgi:hypothetical protein